MTEVLLCSTPLNPQTLQSQCGIPIDQLSAPGRAKTRTVAPYTPYFMGGGNDNAIQSILSQISPQPAKELTNLALSYGDENLVALSDISAKLREYNVGLMGASTSVYANRIGGFAGAVREYQAALMEYRQAVVSNSAVKVAARQNAAVAFKRMQARFGHELHAVTIQARASARRGTPLTSAERATNIARSSRTAVKLQVSSQVQANNLVKFSQHAKFLGNGLAVIDFGSRVGNVHNAYQAGGEWERELFIESSSFAASASTGIIAANLGSAALGFLVAATPIGWVGLIVGGLAIAGTAAAASIYVNGVTKERSGDIYDDIMRSMTRI